MGHSDPWGALADALEVLAQALRRLQGHRAAPVSTETTVHDEWVTIRQFAERHPAFPRGTIAVLVSGRAANGLEPQGIAKQVMGRKVIVHEARLLAWLLREPVPLPSMRRPRKAHYG